MAEQPNKVTVQASRIDASILPPGFSLPYRLYVIQQTTDLKNIADGANTANELAYQAAVKNEEQDAELANHEERITDLRGDVDGQSSRITANTNAITLLEVRVTTAEGKIITLQSDVTYLLNEVVSIEADLVSKSTAANQQVQSAGGSLLVGNVSSPTADKFQVAGSTNITGGYKVSGLQIIGARQTGWTTATGTSNKGAFNADQNPTVSATYQQSEIGAIRDLLVYTRQRVKALEEVLRNHGLIN